MMELSNVVTDETLYPRVFTTRRSCRSVVESCELFLFALFKPQVWQHFHVMSSQNITREHANKIE